MTESLIPGFIKIDNMYVPLDKITGIEELTGQEKCRIDTLGRAYLFEGTIGDLAGLIKASSHPTGKRMV